METGNALEVEALSVWRGRSEIIRAVDLVVRQGECVCIVGSNGEGKTTLIEGLSGMLPARSKRMDFHGKSLEGVRPWSRVRRGLVVVPQERELFAAMSVQQNLLMGGVSTARQERPAWGLDRIDALFPGLATRRAQQASTLSGGERSMLAIGRALMTQPKMLILDEPSLGLAPMVVASIMATIRDINEQGTTVLLVEQNIHQAFALASRAYVLEGGSIVGEGTTQELAHSPLMQHGYLGSAATGSVVAQ